MATPRVPKGGLSWWVANALLDERSLAREFLDAAELRDLVAKHDAWLAQLKQDHPDMHLWDLCSLASGDDSIVRRPRYRNDVFANPMRQMRGNYGEDEDD